MVGQRTLDPFILVRVQARQFFTAFKTAGLGLRKNDTESACALQSLVVY